MVTYAGVWIPGSRVDLDVLLCPKGISHDTTFRWSIKGIT